MKFVHTADWHIGALRNAIPEEYLDRADRMLRSIRQVVEKYSDGVVVVAGDLFNFKAVTERERNLLLQHLVEFDNLGIKTLICNGNHDIISHRFSALRWLSLLTNEGKLPNIHVADCRYRTFQTHGFRFRMCPPREKDEEVSIGKLTEKLKHPEKTIVVCHFATKGSEMDNGYRLPSGIEFGKPKVKPLYWALGDIHKSQRVGRAAYYCGSPVQHNWGEGAGKGVLVVDTDRPDQPKLIPIKSRELITLTEEPDVWPEDCYVKLTVRDGSVEVPDNVVHLQVELDKRKQNQPIVKRLQKHLKTLGIDKRRRGLYLKTIKKALKELEG